MFVAEHVPEKRIGIACGTLTAGLTVGILLGSVVATLINTSLTPQGIHDGGWRIPFLLGGVFGLIAMYLRRWLQETPIFLEMQQRKALAQELPVKAVALKHQKAVVISMLLTPAAVGWRGGGDPDVAGLAAEALWFCAGHYPAGQQHRHHYVVHRLSARRAGGGPLRRQPHFYRRQPAAGGCQLGILPSCRRQPAAAVSALRYGGAVRRRGGAVPYVMVRAFPAEVRFTGISFSYNLSYAIFGGLTPIAVTMLMGCRRWRRPRYVLALSLMGLGLGIWLRQELTAPTGMPEGELQR